MELRRNINPLTGIRGYAAIWVVFFHLRENPYFLSFFNPGKFIEHGFLGVDVFFVLSGFILAHVYDAKFRREFTWREYLHFLSLRLGRIYPLHLAMFFAALLYFALSRMLGQGNANSDDFSLYDAIMNLTLTHAWGTTQHLSWNKPSWSISAEWFAYLFLLIPYIRLFQKRALTTLYVLAALAVGLLMFVYVPGTKNQNLDITTFGIVRIIPEFFAGYVAYRSAKVWRLNTRTCDLMALLGIAGLVLITYHTRYQALLVPTIMLFIIGMAGEGPAVTRLFSNPMSLLFGEISYSIYMCHTILSWFMFSLVTRLKLPCTPGISVMVIAVYLALVLVASYALYTLVEKPSRDWVKAKTNFLRR